MKISYSDVTGYETQWPTPLAAVYDSLTVEQLTQNIVAGDAKFLMLSNGTCLNVRYLVTFRIVEC
jgi:hypothetical protein